MAEEINRHIQQIYDEARLSNLSDELSGLVGRFKS